MKCPYPFIIDKPGGNQKWSRREYGNPLDIKSGIAVPCGKCLICRLNRSAEWSARLVHELQYHKQSCFLTLTYDNDFVPFWSDGLLSLYKPDVQLFFKRFRKYIHPVKIKYFLCGEYGSITHRPHYHIIIFGWAPPIDELIPFRNGWTHEKTDSLWGMGDIQFSGVGPDSIYYVAGYLLKSIFPKVSIGQRSKEFLLCSRGLGLQFAIDNSDKIKKMQITAEGRTISIPRYYLKKVGPVDEKIKIHDQMKSEIAIIQRLLKDKNLELSSHDRILLIDRLRKSREQTLKDVSAFLSRRAESREL